MTRQTRSILTCVFVIAVLANAPFIILAARTGQWSSRVKDFKEINGLICVFVLIGFAMKATIVSVNWAMFRLGRRPREEVDTRLESQSKSRVEH